MSFVEALTLVQLCATWLICLILLRARSPTSCLSMYASVIDRKIDCNGDVCMLQALLVWQRALS